MSVFGGLLIGMGIILIIVGLYYLINDMKRLKSNTEYEWFGFGKHPFRNK